MASREETLLFVVDVQVRNARALAALRAEMDAALANRSQQLLAMDRAARSAAAGHSDLATAIDRVNTAAQGAPAQTDVGMVTGARSNRGPGSRVNPIVVAQESGQAAGLGSLAADSAQRPDVVRQTMGAATASAADKAALADAVRKGTQQAVSAEDARMAAMLDQALAMNRSMSRLGGPQIWDQAAIDALRTAESLPSGRTFTSGETAQRLGISLAQARDMAATGQFAGARKVNGQWVIPEEAVLSAGGSGSGGGRIPPIAFAPGGGGGFGPFGGGGRARTQFLPWRGLVTGPDQGPNPFALGNLFFGNGGNGGMFGLPAFGSLGSLGGLGLEHWLLTGAGLVGSAASAVGGAGLLATAGLSQMAVGGGADMLASATTLSNVKGVYSAYQNLNTAIETYGKNSTQAVQAQQQLNAVLGDLPPKAAAAETAVAKNAAALKSFWMLRSQGAQIQSSRLMEQVLGLGHSITPFLADAAQRNLGIVNQGVAPLFSWLKGPEGMSVFGSLENAFARDLPTAIHAASMGIEDFLRLMQAASKYTGGFARTLDRVFTGKAHESNAQYQEEVQKLVGDFREWERLVKLLAQDLLGLFHADQGTANSIVGSLTQMLQKLHEWEQSTSGHMQLMNIFQVHKKEILALLHVLPELVKAYGSFYMLAAPPLVAAVTDAAKAVEMLVGAIEKIPGGAPLLGLAFAMNKLGVLGPSLRVVGAAMGIIATNEGRMAAGGLLGAGGAAAGAGAAGGAETGLMAGGAGGLFAKSIGGFARMGGAGAITNGVENLGIRAGLTAEGLGIGAGDMIAGGAAALAPIIGTIIPIAVAGLAAYGGYRLLSDLFKGSTPTTSYSSSGLTRLLEQHGVAGLSMHATPGAAAFTPGGRMAVRNQAAQTTVGQLSQSQLQGSLVYFLDTMRNGAAVAKMNNEQLQRMVNLGDALAVRFPKYADSIDRFTNRAKQDLGSLQGAMKLMTDRWHAYADSGLRTLVAVFDQNLGLIANRIGLSSTQGERALHVNVQKMVADLTSGMADGRINVTQGMDEIQKVLSLGLRDSADNWRTYVNDMLAALTLLRSRGKITASLYSQDVNSTLLRGAEAMHRNVLAEYAQMAVDIKQKFQQGADGMVVTQQGLNKKLQNLHQKALSAAASAEIIWLTNLEQSLRAAGKLTVAEMSAITSAIGAASAKASQSVVGFSNLSNRLVTPAGHRASGGMLVGHPMFMVGEDAPTWPEIVLASNPAYRGRNVELWKKAGRMLGIPGFSQGGIPTGGFPLPAGLRAGLGDPGSQQFFAALIRINSEIAAALTRLTNSFNNLQTRNSNQSTLATTLQALHPGTRLGLTGAALRATGLSHRQIHQLIGGGPAGYGALASLDEKQASEYRAEEHKLKAAYREAVRTHNKKLQGQLLSQLAAVDSAMVTAISNSQQAIVDKINAGASQYADKATAAGNIVSTLQAIQGLSPGDSLAALGFSPQILATLGLSGAGSQVGTGLSYYQNLASQQGGYLTSDQLAQAKSGVNAQNSALQAQETPLEQELQYYQNNLGSLSGSARTTAIATMQQLAQQILALQGTIDQNNQSLQQLTSATTQNTQATNSLTGQYTGTVSYSYNGQNGYLASDTVVGLGVGN